MRSWKKTDYFAGGIIYACGDLRKIVINGNKTITYKVSDMKICETNIGNHRTDRRMK